MWRRTGGRVSVSAMIGRLRVAVAHSDGNGLLLLLSAAIALIEQVRQWCAKQ